MTTSLSAPHRPLAALVLCGGQSRRMGRAKAWLPFGGETLLQRVVRLMGTIAAPVVVVAAPESDLPELAPNTIIARDTVLGRGPLQGLVTGLAALPPEAPELVCATATDVPFLKPGWFLRLAERIGPADLAIPRVGEYHHPLAALYRRTTVLPAARLLLEVDRLRPVFLLDSLAARIVTPEELHDVDPDCATLLNLNTPEDYHAALRRAGLPTPP